MTDGAMSEFFARLVADWVLRAIASGWLRHDFVANAEWWGTWHKTVELALQEAEREKDHVRAFGEAIWRQIWGSSALTGGRMPERGTLVWNSFSEFVDQAKVLYAEWVLTR